ncbi:MAG TPA: hypothetical protein VJ723_08295 [Candidatus Angelobacter sp.]|nr:hypothetical protein [Candidatus Angelobacter sp.]
MRFRYLFAGILATLMMGASFAQDCPAAKDKAAAIRFLQEHKAHGTDADPWCVWQAFAALRYDKSNIEVLVDLLDFERSTKDETSLITPDARYPAIRELASMGQPAVPYLIKTIVNNEGALVRQNATWALDEILRSKCRRDVIKLLANEGEKPGTTAEQLAHLREAEDLVTQIHHLCESEMPAQ